VHPVTTAALKHRRAFVFSAYGRKFKPPASRVVVDSKSHILLAKVGMIWRRVNMRREEYLVDDRDRNANAFKDVYWMHF
jgi:hypothetical protein